MTHSASSSATRQPRTARGGFSLLELLLVVGVSSALIMIAIQIFNDFTERSANRRAANHILKIQSSAEEFVAANFTDLWTNDIPNTGDIAEITMADLIGEGFLPDDYRSINVFRQNTRILIRNVGDGFTGGRTIEVLSVTEDTDDGTDRSYPNPRILDAARGGGPKVGVIVNTAIGASCCAGNIQSLNNEWSVPLADFQTSFNYTNDPNRGYLAAYGRVAFSQTFNGDYLYRVEIPGQPQVNQMETNLDMTSNVINGVGVVTADNIGVGYRYDSATGVWVANNAATLEVSGSNTGTGSFTPFALTVDQSITVNNRTSLGFRVIGDASCLLTTQDNLPIAGIPAGSVVSVDGSANPATDCEIVGGDFLLRGDDTAAGSADLAANRIDVYSTDFAAAGGTPSNVVARNVDITTLSAFTYAAGPDNVTDVPAGTPKNIEADFTTVTVRENARTDEFSAFEADFRGTNFTADELQTGSANMENSNVEAANIVAGRVRNVETTNFGETRVENAISSTRGVVSNSIRASDQYFIGNRTRCDTGCDPITP